MLVALHNVYYAYGVKVEKGKENYVLAPHLHFKVGNFNRFKHCFPLCPYRTATGIHGVTNVVISQAKSSGYMRCIYAKHYKVN